MDEYLKSGLKSKIIVTQADRLDDSFIGKELNTDLLTSFPDDVDVCGENGEYHTLCYAGNLFKNEIDFSIGNTHKISQNIKLDNGLTKIFEYWQANIITG